MTKIKYTMYAIATILMYWAVLIYSANAAPFQPDYYGGESTGSPVLDGLLMLAFIIFAIAMAKIKLK